MLEREEPGALFTESSVSNPDQGLSQRIMARLERSTTTLPAGAAGVRGIRSADLVHLVEEAVGPERERLRLEADRNRARIAALEEELQAVRTASDETRRFELPRLAALVDVERSRKAELEQELGRLEHEVRRLEGELDRSRTMQRQTEEDRQRAREEAEDETQTQAEELLLALDERLAALEEQSGAHPRAEEPGAAPPQAEEEERTRLLLEQFAHSEERAARLEALEDALEDLTGAPSPERAAREPASPVRAALLGELLERVARQEARAGELVKTLQVTQELLQKEVRRRTEVERELRAQAVRLAALERSPLLRWSAQDAAELRLPEGGEGLARVVALLRGEGAAREREVREQVERLSLATRSALERMASILDQALALGAASGASARARTSSALDLAGLPRPAREGWTAWSGEGQVLDEELGPEPIEPEPVEPVEPAPIEPAPMEPAPDEEPLAEASLEQAPVSPVAPPAAPDEADLAASDWLADLADESARRRSTPPPLPRPRPAGASGAPPPAPRPPAAAFPGALEDTQGIALRSPADATELTRSPDPSTRRLARGLLSALKDKASLEDKARHAERELESEVWRGFATHRELAAARQRLRELEGRLDDQLTKVEAERAPGATPPPAPGRAASPPMEDALLLRQAERVADLHREVEDRDSVLHWLLLEADPHYHHDKERAIRACEQALEALAAAPDAAQRVAERDQLHDLLHWLRVEEKRERGEAPFPA